MIKTEELIDRVLKLDAEATPDWDARVYELSNSAQARFVWCEPYGFIGQFDAHKDAQAAAHYRTAAPILAKMLRLSVNYLKACASEKLEGNKYQSELTLAELDRIVTEGLEEK